MPDPITPADEAVLQRRRFLRGGALLAAAAGGAVVATASSAVPASADTVYPSSVTFPVPPERLLDTRSAQGLKAVVASSSGALDSKNRLKQDAWIDVAVAKIVDDANVDFLAVFVNLKSLASTKGGSLVVSAPGDKPTGTTVTYRKNETTTNSAIVGLGTVAGSYVVRIFATSTSHVTLDLTGVEVFSWPLVADGNARGAGLARVLKAVRAVER